MVYYLTHQDYLKFKCSLIILFIIFYSISILLMCIFILKKNTYYVIKLNTALFTTHISNIYIDFLLVFIKYNIQTIMKLILIHIKIINMILI